MKSKRWISLVLAVGMLLSLLPALSPSARAVEVISEVAVLVDEPVAGMAVTGAADIAAGTGYTVVNVSWEPADDVFQPGRQYGVAVSLEAKEKHVFADSITAAINGHAAKIIARGPEEMKIVYTFDKVPYPRPSMYFDDVQTSDWFYHDVEYVYYNGLMNGTASNLFSPELATSRGMIVTILYRIEGSPEVSGSCPFTDVVAGRYYEKPIIWARENGMVDGVGHGRFDPDGKITREQMATILCRYAKYKDLYHDEDCAMLVGFADNGDVSNWARESMSWAVGTGLIGGINRADGAYLDPGGNAIRCQAAAILHRFCENVKPA